MREKQTERTRNAIVEGFIDLLEQKSFGEITVQNIADAAPIARSSFYHYFHDKYEIAEYLQDSILMQIRENSYVLVNHMLDPKAHSLQPLQKVIQQTRRGIMAVLKIKTDTVDLLGKWEESIKQTYLQQHADSPTALAEAKIYSAVLVQLMLYPLQASVPLENMMVELTDIQIRAFLNLLGLGNDRTIKDLLRKKLQSRQCMPPPMF